MSNRKILIFGLSANPSAEGENPAELLDKRAIPDLRLSTDANGETRLGIPKRAPAHFYVHAELSGPVWDCTCLVRVDTEKLADKGLEISNAQDDRSPGKFRTQPTPGTILFRLRPTAWWVRAFWPLLKG